METRSHALPAGLFVLLIAALAAGVLWWLSARDGGARMLPYEVVTRDSVAGLTENTSVTYRGVEVGTIRRIGLDEESFDTVVVRIEVDERVPIGERTFAVLNMEGITGSMILGLADDGSPGPRLETSDRDPAEIPLKPGLLESLGTSGGDLLLQLNGLVADVRTILGPENQETFNDFLATANQAAEILVDLERGLEPTIASLPDLTARIDGALAKLESVVDDAGGLVAEVRTEIEGLDRALDGVRELGEVGSSAGVSLTEGTLPRLNDLLVELDQAVRTLSSFTQTLERNPQSLLFGPPEQPPGPGEKGYRRPNP